MDRWKFGLVGCGRIAKRHSELLGHKAVPGASLGAVCDVVPERAKAIADEFGVPWFVDMHEMMRSGLVNAVSVLTESGKHPDQVIELAGYGMPIVVEKPMALSLDDADRMILACEEANVRLFVVKQNRFNVPVIKLRDALQRGRFGKLVLGTVRVRWCRPQSYYDQASWRGTWALDGGVLTNQASHHIDLLEWMMGEVESVQGMATTSLAHIEAEDTAIATLKFASGALGVIEATTAARPTDLEGSLSILGSEGTVVIGGFAVNKMLTWRFTHEEEGDAEVLERYSVNPPSVYGFGHQAYYQHVVDCLDRSVPHLVDGTHGRRSLQLIHAIYKSIETGQRIDLKSAPVFPLLGRRDG